MLVYIKKQTNKPPCSWVTRFAYSYIPLPHRRSLRPVKTSNLSKAHVTRDSSSPATLAANKQQ